MPSTIMPDTTIFLAKIFGPLLTVIGAGILINPEHYRRMISGFMDDLALVYVSGFIAFVGGMLMVLVHNEWAFSRSVVITILAWMILLKGILLILFPVTVKKYICVWQKRPWLLKFHAFVAILFGVTFTLRAYFFFR